MSTPFKFEDKKQFELEFTAAKAYFKAYPNATKLKKNTSFNNITVKHSFVKTKDIYTSEDKIFALASNKPYNKIGEGGSANVKYAIEDDGSMVSMKIEEKTSKEIKKTSDAPGKLESIILKAKRYLKSIPLLRQTKQTQYKLYTPMTYLGSSLLAILQKKHLTVTERLAIFIKLGIAINKLHKQGIAHLDIKPANTTLDDNDALHLIDFGLSQFLNKGDDFHTYAGTAVYMPYPKDGDRIRVMTNMDRLGLKRYDVFCYKRVGYIPNGTPYFNPKENYALFDEETFNQFSDDLKNALNTQDLENAIENPERQDDTPLRLAALAICYRYQLDSSDVKNDPKEQQKLADFYETKPKNFKEEYVILKEHESLQKQIVEHKSIVVNSGIEEKHRVSIAEKKDDFGNTLLHMTCSDNNNMETLESLCNEFYLQNSLPLALQEKNNSGDTVIHTAVRHILPQPIIYLLNKVDKKERFRILMETNKSGATGLYNIVANPNFKEKEIIAVLSMLPAKKILEALCKEHNNRARSNVLSFLLSSNKSSGLLKNILSLLPKNDLLTFKEQLMLSCKDFTPDLLISNLKQSLATKMMIGTNSSGFFHNAEQSTSIEKIETLKTRSMVKVN